MYPEYVSDLSFCKKIHRTYGKSFYFGTLLMTPAYRDAICILYAFFRLPDEYIDTTYKDQKNVALQKLHSWKEQWSACYQGKEYAATGDERKVLRATKYVFDTYHIPFNYSEAFIAAMIQDTSKATYQTYEELEEYMYGSAVVVGLMMVYIVCSNDPLFRDSEAHRDQVLLRAKALGEAFQMTNFLRDIHEDLKERSRVYIPQDDMRRFGVTEHTLATAQVTPAFMRLVAFEIERTRELYKQADAGLLLLPKREARAIRVARVLYAKILDKIEDATYDVFASRAYVGFSQKIVLTLVTLLKKT